MSAAHRARKRFGQHFLVDGGIISDIVSSVAASSDDTVVEIGPGQGAITAPLADSGATLHAIEFDRDLAALLRDRFHGYANVEIHEADALTFDYATFGEDLRIVGNLPYNISTPLLFHLVEFRHHIRDLHLMLQKEVVDRMTASPGNKRYGRLTVMLGCFMQMARLFDVPPSAFAPPPKVMSSVVALRPWAETTYEVDDPDALSALLARAFSQRRKTLRNALKGVVAPETLEELGIDPGWRPEQVPIDDWIALAGRIRNAL